MSKTALSKSSAVGQKNTGATSWLRSDMLLSPPSELSSRAYSLLLFVKCVASDVFNTILSHMHAVFNAHATVRP